MSMAVKYAMKKRMAKGGEAEDSVTSPVQVSGTNMGCRGPECMGCSSPKCMAKGGDMMGDDDLVMHIMKKRYSKGGEVANDSDPIVDEMPAEYDDLVKDDGLEMHETGANSGDELGDEQVEEDDEDTVSKIMKSRKKKDRMPRPA